MNAVLGCAGHLTTDDGEVAIMASTREHLEFCQNHVLGGVVSKRCSYGWHPEQLAAAEYVSLKGSQCKSG